MTLTRLSAVAALALITVVAACGGGDSTGPAFADSVSTADALDNADAADGIAGQLMGTFNFGTPGLSSAVPSYLQHFAAAQGVQLRGVRTPWSMDLATAGPMAAAIQLASSEGCTVTSRGFNDIGSFGDPVDLNANGIPDDFLVTIDCHFTDSTSSPDTVFTSHVYEQVGVKERMADLWGWDLTETVLERADDSFGNFNSISINADEHSSINAGAANSSVVITEAEDSKLDTASHHAAFGENWNGNFDPTGTIVLGDPLPNGSLTFSGRIYAVDDLTTNISFSLSTPTALAYHGGCGDPPFDSGVVHGMLNNHASLASFDVTYTGCGVAPTVTTSGTFASPMALR